MNSWAVSGKASASDSSVVASFLLGRRRFFRDLLFCVCIFFTNDECFMMRLSFLDEAKADSVDLMGLGIRSRWLFVVTVRRRDVGRIGA